MSEFHHRNRTLAQDEAKWQADAAKVREADEAKERQALINQAQHANAYLASLERGRERLVEQIRESQENNRPVQGTDPRD
jgi:hypothetical protein